MESPKLITDMATAYWASMMLLTANRFQLFSALSGRELSAAELATTLSASPPRLELLLNACAAHGLLEKHDGRYRNTDVTEAFLVPGKPAYLGDALRYAEDMYPVWGNLPTAVQTEQPVFDPETILGEDPQKTRNFVLSMHNRALGIAASMANQIDLTGRKKLLDVGGGPGTYSILLVRKTDGLKATVLDLQPVTEIAKEIIDGYGVGDRIRVTAGNYLQSSFESGNDAVLMSGMMHRELPSTCRQLLQKAHASLDPEGLLIVADVFFDDTEKTKPPFTTLFALNMMLTSNHGSAHAKTEMAEWMREAGFKKRANATTTSTDAAYNCVRNQRLTLQC